MAGALRKRGSGPGSTGPAPGQVAFKDIRVQVPGVFVSAPLGNATAEVIITIFNGRVVYSEKN